MRRDYRKSLKEKQDDEIKRKKRIQAKIQKAEQLKKQTPSDAVEEKDTDKKEPEAK
ncbi:MAG: hypothetical protein KAQ68_02685 [Clostridiales bacterium]|nr:hypothetical protein [Clostridiales bacterium]